ncbi:MAG: hypothetical protein QW350_05220 [Candidatus Aenigmatarchaeota archaeon]
MDYKKYVAYFVSFSIFLAGWITIFMIYKQYTSVRKKQKSNNDSIQASLLEKLKNYLETLKILNADEKNEERMKEKLKEALNGPINEVQKVSMVRSPIIKDGFNDLMNCHGNTPSLGQTYRIVNQNIPNFENEVFTLIYNPDFKNFPLRLSKDYNTGFYQVMYKDYNLLIGPFFDLCIERSQVYGQLIVSPVLPSSQSKKWLIKNGKISDPYQMVCLSVRCASNENIIIPYLVPVSEASNVSCSWNFILVESGGNSS